MFNPWGNTWDIILSSIIIDFLLFSGNFEIISNFNFEVNSVMDDSYKNFSLNISGLTPISIK